MKRERQEMGWGKGELLTSLTFSLVGSFHLFLFGVPFPQVCLLRAGALDHPGPTTSLPSSIRITREARPPRVNICGPGGAGRPHTEPGERAGRLSASAQPDARLCLTRIPTPAPPAPSLTLCGWRSGSLFRDSKQPCCPSRAPTQAGAQCCLGGGFSASTIPKEVAPPPPHHTAHHFIRLPESYPSSPLQQASGGQSLHGPDGRWASSGAARATGHHTGWCLAASRRIRKAQRSPYQRLPGKSL